MSNIEIYLIGGTGNNLFQLALGMELQRMGHVVTYNTFFRRPNIVTKLLGWSIHEDKLVNFILGYENCNARPNMSAVAQIISSFILHRLGVKDLFTATADFFETSGSFWWRILGSRVFIGYWQEGPHLNRFIVNQLSKLVNEYYNEQCIVVDNKINTHVICHYRAGDFPEEWRLGKVYYDEALDYFGDRECLVVTNDIDVAKKVWMDEASVISTSFDVDFATLMKSKWLICSNSTLCYWAATLGSSQIVIVPSHLNRRRRYGATFFDKTVVVVPVVYEKKS